MTVTSQPRHGRTPPLLSRSKVMIVASFVLLAQAGFAQNMPSSPPLESEIVVRVIDADGAVVPGVEMTFESSSGAIKIKTYTNEAGESRVKLPSDQYVVMATQAAFTTAKVLGFRVQAPTPASLNISLRVRQRIFIDPCCLEIPLQASELPDTLLQEVSDDPSHTATPVKIDEQVAMLIEKMLRKKTEHQAFSDLEALRCAAVPAIIKRMDDRRNLPDPTISLENKSPDAFEGLRHYGPKKVVDALAAILNQLTGEDFGSIYNGGTDQERTEAVKGWRDWLRKTPQGKRCEGG